MSKFNWGQIKKGLFSNQNTRQTVLKNTFWLGTSNFASRLIKAVLIIYAARILGTAGYGVFSYALSLAAFFAIFSDIGVSALITREVSRDPKIFKKYFSAGLLIKIVLVSLSAVLILLVAPHITKIEGAISLLPIAALLIAVDGIRDFLASLTRAWEQMEREALVTITTNIAITIIGISILMTNGTPTGLLLGYTAGSIVGLILSVFMIRDRLKGKMELPSFKLMKKIIVEAWPFALVALLGAIILNTDTIIIGALRNEHELGLYAAAQRPILLLYLIPSILSTSLFPQLARRAKENKDDFQKVFGPALRIIFLASLPLTIGGIITAPLLINLLFGTAYVGAISSFVVLLGTLLVVFPQTLLTNAIFAYGTERKFIYLTLGGVIMNIALDLLLIPQLGIVGSAIATLITQIGITAYMWAILKRKNNFSLFANIKPIALATIIMGLVTAYCVAINLPLIPILLIAAGVYVISLKLLKEPLLENVLRHIS